MSVGLPYAWITSVNGLPTKPLALMPAALVYLATPQADSRTAAQATARTCPIFIWLLPASAVAAAPSGPRTVGRQTGNFSRAPGTMSSAADISFTLGRHDLHRDFANSPQSARRTD